MQIVVQIVHGTTLCDVSVKQQMIIIFLSSDLATLAVSIGFKDFNPMRVLSLAVLHNNQSLAQMQERIPLAEGNLDYFPEMVAFELVLTQSLLSRVLDPLAQSKHKTV